MKKKLKITSLFLLLFGLCGCGLNVIESPEKTLCTKLEASIDKYDSKQISFNNFAAEVINESDIFCNENKDSNVCTQVYLIKSQSEYDYTLQDCNSQIESLREICEATNNLKKNMLAKRVETENATVSNLKRQCEIINEK